MGRVRSLEEVQEIKRREKIKLSLVLQQRELNRLIYYGGCPTARGKVYITSIFEKNGHLAIREPQLCLICMIREHLNQKDYRNRRASQYDAKLDEEEMRKYCATHEYKETCKAYKRFIQETDSTIVKRELKEDEATPKTTIGQIKMQPSPAERAAAAKAREAGASSAPATAPATTPAAAGTDPQGEKKTP